MARYAVLLLFILVGSTASAELYRWVDKEGGLHFTSTPPPASARDVVVLEAEPSEPPVEPEQGGSPPVIRLFKDKLYTDEKIQTEMARLEKELAYNNGPCRTEARPEGKDREFWANWCDDAARRTQRSIDVLKVDPDRYFYVVDQMNKKARGEPGDNPPRYRHWN